MSESLTAEDLDFFLKHAEKDHTFEKGILVQIISMARRCLSAEERLERLLGNPEGSASASGEEIPAVTDVPAVERPTFDAELSALINRYSMERFSGTPDFILAEYLQEQLHLFSKFVVKRMEWHGNSDFGVMGYDSKTGTTSVPA